jgi:pimeloyl-ACP methyl ester carboxylesterase
MGVQVCLETWRRYPERVRGLVLICGSYGTPLRTFRGSRTLEDLLPFVRLAVHAMPRAVAAVWRAALPTQLAFRIATLLEIDAERVRPEDFFPYLEHMASIDVRLFVDMLAAAGRHTAREILGDIDVPSLVVGGDRDGFTPLALSEEMHRLIPGSALHVVRGGTHTAPIENPDEVTAAIAGFVRSHA